MISRALSMSESVENALFDQPWSIRIVSPTDGSAIAGPVDVRLCIMAGGSRILDYCDC